MPEVLTPEIVGRAQQYATRTAITDDAGAHSYTELLEASARVASRLRNVHREMHETRVALLAPANFEFVAAQWGIWRAGGLLVPLAISHPPAELAYVIRDSGAGLVLVHPSVVERVEAIAGATTHVVTTTEALAETPGPLSPVDGAARALMLYTSGTTGKPKGVVTTHQTIAAHLTALSTAWEWSRDDHILLALPLHHAHGLLNVLTSALWNGAQCTMLLRFDADQVFHHFSSRRLTLFMAVPTIYRRLITAWEDGSAELQSRVTTGAQTMRLMVSGSAALPVEVLDQWREITGHVLLERYGTSEAGMLLANPLHGRRTPGHVGTTLPGVRIRLVDEAGEVVAPGEAGEVEAKSDSMFREYWNRPEETQNAFRDGWYRTGDMAVQENDSYRILGRKSLDIIKSGGYKISALEVEDTLRTHRAIADCAVVGVPDPEWGERIGVAVEFASGCELTLDELRGWAKERLAPYKVPTLMRSTAGLPRNAMGKVQKTDVIDMFAG